MKPIHSFVLPGDIPLDLIQTGYNELIFEIPDIPGGWKCPFTSRRSYIHNPFGPAAIQKRDSELFGNISDYDIKMLIHWMDKRISTRSYDSSILIPGSTRHGLFGSPCDYWKETYIQSGRYIDVVTPMASGLKMYPHLASSTWELGRVSEKGAYRRALDLIREAQSVSVEEFISTSPLFKARVLVAIHRTGLIVLDDIIYENLVAMIQLGS